MVKYSPKDGKWQIGPKATEVIRLRKELTPEDYEADKEALQKFLCNYFSNVACNRAQGSSISPVGATKSGGKILKVRWGYPGCGKSGSMRLVVVAFCDEKRVHITGAFPRKSDPSDEEVLDTTEGL